MATREYKCSLGMDLNGNASSTLVSGDDLFVDVNDLEGVHVEIIGLIVGSVDKDFAYDFEETQKVADFAIDCVLGVGIRRSWYLNQVV